jgi:hypothetical protein
MASMILTAIQHEREYAASGPTVLADPGDHELQSCTMQHFTSCSRTDAMMQCAQPS